MIYDAAVAVKCDALLMKSGGWGNIKAIVKAVKLCYLDSTGDVSEWSNVPLC